MFNFFGRKINSFNKRSLTSLTETKINSYSQKGEDIILQKIFRNEKNSFYVDISNFGRSFSNTYYFYINGWKGLNIFCQPIDQSKLLIREKDINVYKVISTKNEIRKRIAISNNSEFDFRNSFTTNENDGALKEIKNECLTLEQALKNYLPYTASFQVNSIGILNIEAPGNESDIIMSNNWNIYRPKVIVLQFSEQNELGTSEAFQFFQQKDYILFARICDTWFYREKGFLINFG